MKLDVQITNEGLVVAFLTGRVCSNPRSRLRVSDNRGRIAITR